MMKVLLNYTFPPGAESGRETLYRTSLKAASNISSFQGLPMSFWQEFFAQMVVELTPPYEMDNSDDAISFSKKRLSFLN